MKIEIVVPYEITVEDASRILASPTPNATFNEWLACHYCEPIANVEFRDRQCYHSFQVRTLQETLCKHIIDQTIAEANARVAEFTVEAAGGPAQ